VTAPKPEAAPRVDPMQIIRTVTEHGERAADRLEEEAAEHLRVADEQRKLAMVIREMYAIAEPHVPRDRQGILEMKVG